MAGRLQSSRQCHKRAHVPFGSPGLETDFHLIFLCSGLFRPNPDQFSGQLLLLSHGPKSRSSPDHQNQKRGQGRSAIFCLGYQCNGVSDPYRELVTITQDDAETQPRLEHRPSEQESGVVMAVVMLTGCINRTPRPVMPVVIVPYRGWRRTMVAADLLAVVTVGVLG